MSTQPPEDQTKKKQNNSEQSNTVIEEIADTIDFLGCLFFPFRLMWGLIKFVVNFFD